MRFHLFEFEDQAWFPDILRRGMTQYLKTAIGLFPFARMWADKLTVLASDDGSLDIVDLGSGSGGALLAIAAELRMRGLRPDITLTDLYPNPEALGLPDDALPDNSLRYWPAPVDASTVPAELRGIRTMFLSFHHLRPESARAVLRNAFEQKQAICVFEAGSREATAFAGALQIPLAVLFLTPLIRPVRASQLIFTYLLPLLPLCMFWDGMVSNMRIYTPREMLAMTEDMRAPDYAWEAGTIKVPRLPGNYPWLIGRPVR